MKNVFFFTAFLLIGFYAISNPQPINLNCPSPVNVSVTDQYAGAISFDWEDCVGGCNSYSVWYETGDYTSQQYLTNNSDISYSGLSAGTYDFYFVTDCGGAKSDAIVIEDRLIQ
ncbi:MAG TPA: hypothetical protein ENJ95_24190 [Bacteroidetes bacterium]|nr:hypothetical protein [Bacteroidota bacterium]